MAHYVSRGCQTDIQGLCHDPAPRPQPLVSLQPANNSTTANNITGTPTPPDDMALDKTRLPAHDAPVTSSPAPSSHAPQTEQHNYTTSTMQPSMLLKRKTRPALVARISLPGTDILDEDPRSPPPTEALMSPLPAANRLHAGHTPIIPRALSPLPPSSGTSSPGGDDPLSGPLTLPPQPGDGAEDTIPLHVLDAELEKLRLAQERSASERSDSVEPDDAHEDDAAPPAARTAKENRRTPTEDVVDGVILKKPRMNMGAPLGQA
ncbi:hypothetical protein P171DRAFT_428727 [Karstenula rhodostoma CBS 690.94]|uniref:Uncharacterized protein n=1 Tax=Karstenula rhodostoma CBS 690.94 TaxID=1392251 RepID=A0A9P4PTU2_9PLEO|nr:hypothetical protein P171DRAFT_428727 [Karstenula rhodostoma CBS 690.94]